MPKPASMYAYLRDASSLQLIAMQAAVLGTLNVVQQGQKLGIKLFSVASSISACISSDEPFRKLTDKDWNNARRKQAIASNDPLYMYFARKALAEKALREFEEQHNEIAVVICQLILLVGGLKNQLTFAASKPAIVHGSSCTGTNHSPW